MIITSPKNYDQAVALKSYCDGYLVGINDYTPQFLSPFSYEDFLKLLDLKQVVILRLDLLLQERDIAKYKILIEKVKLLEIYYYITDLGLLNYLQKLGLIAKVIYDPFTMITNKMDAKTYYELGVDAIAPSLEIPYRDVLSFTEPLFYLGFGRRLMFNSKRKLLSLYKEEKQLDFSLKDLTIVEEKRTDILPIFEDGGTFIYRSYFVNNLFLTKDNPQIKYLLIDSLTIPEEVYTTLCQYYWQYLNAEKNQKDLENYLKTNHLLTADGFTYQDSIYQKEEIINEKN